MAVKGNFDAIHNIFHQHRDKVSFDEAIAAYGNKQSFVNAVHDFFVHKAGAGDGDTVHAENPRHVPDFASVSDFTEDEILRAVHRLKPGKTAGPSGCSADFLKALCSAGPGLQLLQSHLNLILRNCPLDEQRVAELILVPKLLHIGSVDQFRPIALMECIHKLYMALLVHRIQPTWDEPRFQMGGYPGSQVLSALFCATAQLEKQSLEGKHGIWISADIKSAFDTVSWSKLESSLYDNTPDAVYPELQRLLHEIKSHHISLHWEGRKSHIPLARGVLQGGTHSAQVFSMMMEALFTELYKRWSHEHPGEVRGWCYIDDCLLWFSSWNVLQSVYPWLLERFAEYGFAFNPRKSVLCSTVEGLRKGNACRPHLHPDLQTFQWSTSFKYLGLHLEIPSLYLEDGENLTASLFKQAKSRVIGTVRTLKQLLAKQHHARWYTAVQLLNVFVASKWLWMCPCMHPTRAKLDDVQSLQLGILCSVLNLYVPDGLQLDRRQALHRIRRRAVLELLRLQCPTMQWTWSWISRKWCFLGHLLRRPCQHQATATLLEPIKQVRSGRAVTGGRWLVSTFKAIGYQVEDVEALYNLYWTKEDWSEHLPQVMKAHQIPVPSLLPEWKASTWSRWNHAFTHDVSWFGTSVVVQTPDCINFKWLQPEHGWMQHSVSGTWETAIQDHCRWHAMSQTRPLFTIQLMFSETSHPETKLSVQQAVHALYVNRTECRELVPVILLEIVDPSIPSPNALVLSNKTFRPQRYWGILMWYLRLNRFQALMDQLAEQHAQELEATAQLMQHARAASDNSATQPPKERRESRHSSASRTSDEKRRTLARSGTVAAQVMCKYHQDIPEVHAEKILDALDHNEDDDAYQPVLKFRESRTMAGDGFMLETESEYLRRLSQMTRLEKVQRALQSPQYEMFMAFVLCLNVVWMAVELQLEGTVTGQGLDFWPGMTDHLSQSRPTWDSVLLIGEMCFTSFFALDVICRMCLLRGLFWKSWLNYLDVAVSITSIVELSVTVSAQLPVSPVLFRLLRLGKLARAIRVVSMSSVLASLQLLVKCLASSRDMLFWSFCLLTFVQCVAGMILSTLCSDFINDPGRNLEIRKEVFLHYGTFTRTFLSMFEILFANWSPPCRVLVENVSEWFSVFFLLYRCVLGFAVLNVVNSVFVQQTMKTASSDEELAFKQKQRDVDMYTKKVRKLFSTMDASGDGAINLQEFAKLVQSPKLRFWMSQLELEYHDLLSLFEFLDNGDGQITLPLGLLSQR
ncbi:CACNA1I [Symbiodinium natans]|uniref:CACNA1I protein n=1 Tax=Symbiodinium natans TaxID=878477 RepID=A0A812JJD1_9DINO|nr:CACNA1I [Symbiodinium natans]